jgi:ribokinase
MHELIKEWQSIKQIVVIGSLNQDWVVGADHIVRVGETILTQEYHVFPGGKGANQAYAMGKLGGEAAMLGAVGNDDAGKYLLDNLKTVGVDVSGIKVDPQSKTGMAWIVVDKHRDNSIVVIQGANQTVDSPYINANKSMLEQSDVVVLQLEIPIETVVYAAKPAKFLSKCVILDPAPAVGNLPDELFEYVDLIKPNEAELSILTGSDIIGGDYGEKALQLRQKGVKNVIATLGDKGIFAALEDGRSMSIPGLKVDVVDTTAAGDSFLAALAVCLCEGGNIEEAIHFAQRVAAIVVSRSGAQTSIPSREELDAE